MAVYDSIGSKYDVVGSLPFKVLEEQNCRASAESHLTPGCRVLELACGSGFYTERLLLWGAGSITAVDISATMLDIARQRHSGNYRQMVRFLQGDAGTLTHYERPEYFDVAFAGWLLNYAADRDGLVAMFRNITANLKAGGHFIAVVYPHMDMEHIEERKRRFENAPMNRLWPRNDYFEQIGDQGWKIHIDLDGQTRFDSIQLTGAIYDEAMKEAGFDATNAVWREQLPGEEWKEKLGLDEAEFEIWKSCPQCVVLTVKKL